MTLTKEEVAEITGDTVEDIARITSTDHLDNGNVMKLPEPDGDVVHCDLCGASFHGTMAKAQLGRHKSAKHGIRKMKEETVKTSEQAKTEIPTSETYLSTVLKAFSVPNQPGILLAMQNSEDVPRLKDMLRAVATPASKIDGILTLYKEYLGIKSSPVEDTSPSQQSPLKQTLSTLSDTIALQSLQKIADGGGSGGSNTEVTALKSQLTELSKHIEEVFVKKEAEEKLKNLEGSINGIGGVLKDFMLDQDKKFTDFLHRQELKEKDKMIEQMQTSASAPLAEKMMTRVADTADRVLGGVGKFNVDLINRTAANDLMEQAQRLRAMGFQPPEVMRLIDATKEKPRVVDATAEYQNLQRIAEAEEARKVPPQQPQPAPGTVDFLEASYKAHAAKPPEIKMNVDSG